MREEALEQIPVSKKKKKKKETQGGRAAEGSMHVSLDELRGHLKPQFSLL